MSINTKHTLSFVWITYFLVSLIMLILYPFWIVFFNPLTRVIFFGFLLIAFLVSNFFFYKKLRKCSLELEPRNPPASSPLSIVLVIVLAILSQLPLILLFPLTSYTDETSYASSGMYLAKALGFLSHGHNLIFSSLAILSIVAIYLFRTRITELINKRFFLFSSIFVLFSAGYYYLISKFFIAYASLYSAHSIQENALRLLGGLKSMIFALPMTLFGHTEFAVRFPCLIAYILSAIFLYKLVLKYSKNQKTAVYSSILLLFFPGFFYFGNMALDASILALTALASLYFLLEYFDSKNFKFLFYSFMALTFSALFDKKAIFIFIPLFMIILINHLIIRREGISWIKDYLIISLLSALIFAPYLALNSLSFVQGVSEAHKTSLLSPENILNLPTLMKNAELMPNLIGTSSTILLLFALIYSAYRTAKGSKFNLYVLVLYLAVYVLFTLMVFVGLPRYLSPFCFIFAFLIAQLLTAIETKISSFRFISVIFLIFVVSGTLYSAYTASDQYLPMNELFSYIQSHAPEDARFLKTMAPGPYNFYILKYGLNINNFDSTIWMPAENQTVENLYSYMEKNNLSYVFFPLPTPAYGTYFYKAHPASWVDLWQVYDKKTITIVNHNLIQKLYGSPNSLFEKEAEFHLGGNTLFLLKRKV